MRARKASRKKKETHIKRKEKKRKRGNTGILFGS